MLFDINAVLTKMLVNVAVLMIFGLVSPLLDVTVAVDSVVILVLRRVVWEKYENEEERESEREQWTD